MPALSDVAKVFDGTAYLYNGNPDQNGILAEVLWQK